MPSVPPSLCPSLACRSFEIGEEKVVESGTGTVKRSTASLGEGGHPDGYTLVSETVSTGGHSSLLHVETRQLSPGGHVHTQVLWRIAA